MLELRQRVELGALELAQLAAGALGAVDHGGGAVETELRALPRDGGSNALREAAAGVGDGVACAIASPLLPLDC